MIDLTAALRESRADLDALGYSAVHHLRAPVRALLGLLDAFEEEHAAQVSPGGRLLLAQMTASAGRAAALLEGLIRLARAAGQPLAPAWVDASALVAHVVQELAAVTPAGTGWQIAPHMQLWADPAALAEMLREGCSNALRFGGGQVVQVWLDRSIQGRRCLCIRDHGAGFDARHADKLFQPFQRLHRDDEYPGIGVGLALCARLVARHAGVVVLEAAEGGGACLRITLPDPA